MTTGRINQVATLRDVSRAGPCGLRTRPSLGRIESNRSFGTFGDRGPGSPRHAPHPREQQRPAGQARRSSRLGWIAGAASWSSGRAPCEAPDGRGTMSGRSVPPSEGGGRTGTQRRQLPPRMRQLPLEACASFGGPTEVDSVSTVRCASTEPANTSNPITTHTPTRVRDQRLQTNHAPRVHGNTRASGGIRGRRSVTARHEHDNKGHVKPTSEGQIP